jgi:uncharacterized protein YbaA (DUF1428 family)
MTYVDSYVLPIATDRVDDYVKMAQHGCALWMEHGALSYHECVLEDAEDKGFCATFPKGFQTQDGETVVVAFITYKDRAHRDEVNAKVMADPRLMEACDPDNMPFDCKRMVFGGFKTIVSA